MVFQKVPSSHLPLACSVSSLHCPCLILTPSIMSHIRCTYLLSHWDVGFLRAGTLFSARSPVPRPAPGIQQAIGKHEQSGHAASVTAMITPRLGGWTLLAPGRKSSDRPGRSLGPPNHCMVLCLGLSRTRGAFRPRGSPGCREVGGGEGTGLMTRSDAQTRMPLQKAWVSTL